ncbi:MAG: hypothetical protein ACYDFR_03295 [Candidatus Omnitrophota bacterium]
MKECPIIFSGEMVKAIIEDRKTQTRIVIKDLPCYDQNGYKSLIKKCHYGQPGDRLWVKETWRVGAWAEDDGAIAVDYKAGDYCRREWIKVDNDELFTRLWQQSTDDASKALGVLERYDWKPGESPCRWRPPIYMPRLAARFILEIVNIKIERLQDITVTECLKEGIHPCRPLDDFGKERIIFKGVWDSINGQATSWDKNPWVWVIEFKNIEDKRMSPAIVKVIKQGEELMNK